MLRGDPSSVRIDYYKSYRYTDQIYKVIKFKSIPLKVYRPYDENTTTKHYDKKLDSSVSRTRRLILEKALCNHWTYFASLTLDPNKYDRYNLPLFYKDLSQFLRDTRKKGYPVLYLLVPELHDDGAWHIHGFFDGLPELVPFYQMRLDGHKVPNYLVDHSFFNWPAYQSKFGFCSFGKINSPVRSAFYISKYITKEHNKLVSDLNCKMFYSSQGLNKAVPHGEIYGSCPQWDQFIDHHYEFCSVGMTKVSNQQNWTFGLDQEGFVDLWENMTPLVPDKPSPGAFMDEMAVINYEQQSFF